ncbi:MULTISPECIES: biotin-dependent carboxyltransferase family protein [Microbulbifer]|uniref:5-oxoprolinase subunit C family protein n=1 Tax=Microbulbifer TaxID=48073 RepID=UPI001E3868C0|nr:MULTISPECIES: biotin-dependent carboxyltransferase family protein [Microbulbifer]UHQ56039.1 biotin-dependent carboxyltransferase family protein [Microbulbifer sp. YPW16]
MGEFATVERAGPLTLIQDSGRHGQRHLGVSPGGALDRHAAGWANRLLRNAPGDALLEITLGPFAMRFSHATTFSLAGAECNWRLDGRPVANWAAHRAESGSLLEAEVARSGVRSYLALAGGIQAEPVWGSRATTVGERIGGIAGRSLRSGDRLPYIAAAETLLAGVPREYIREYGGDIPLRLVPSNQFELFSSAHRQTLLSQAYRVSPLSDRMGVRLEGSPMTGLPGSMISEAVAPGAVQVPSNGQPIVLMADCQTIGGYPKIGHVYSVDLDLLAQARPGATVLFSLGTLEGAQQALRQQRRFFECETG